MNVTVSVTDVEESVLWVRVGLWSTTTDMDVVYSRLGLVPSKMAARETKVSRAPAG